jgi:hypothetical protein
MKKLIVVMLSLITVYSYAQKTAPTTQDEYTYVTKGLKGQIESGVGVKPGYKLVDLGQHNEGGKTLNVSGMYRDGENHPCAIVLVYKNGGKESYLCMPTEDAPSVLWDNYMGSLKVMGENLSWADYYLHHLLMRYINK